ncbi:MAG: GLUG motif-containing protein, partial [Candidatus Marinimicrobia bacterium]|nr:GLUG motif-containing protein [Candidatus Neomarinimicrobiota bacterium]
MKKILTSSLVILLAMCTSLLAQTATAPSFGDGSSGSPYQISTLNHLYWITQNSSEWDKYYIQTANIDAFSTSSWDSNEGFSRIGGNSTKFTGSYDGDGYTINGLRIARSSTHYIGLFGITDGATIQDLGVTNVNITGYHYVGGLVGIVQGNSTVSNCYSTGSVTSTGSYIGGLAGEVKGSSTVSKCYSTGSVTGKVVGGLSGVIKGSSTVSNCYSTGSVTGIGNYAGGLAGYIYNEGVTVSDCYSTGSVTDTTTYTGGFVGRVRFSPTVSNCFWDTQTSGHSSSADGTGKTTAQMKTASTFYAASWDFEEDGNGNDNGTNGGASGNGTNNYWDMDQDGNNYPVLSWQDGVTVLVTDLTDPSAPTGLIATPGNTQVVLTWAANSEGDLASYKVYRGTSASPTTLLSTITAGTETSTEESLTNGTLYYFNISALDNVGNEGSVTSDVSSLSHNPSGDYSLSFDGVSDYVNVNAVANEMSSVTDWAVSFWVKPNLNSFPEAEGDAVGVNTSSGGNIVLVGMKKIGGFPTIYDGASSDTEIVGSTGVSSSSWNHIVYSRSGSTGSLYLNGVSQGTHIPNYTFSSSDKWTLGGEYDNTTITNEYAGFLDEVAVWNDDLTAEEITALYNSGMPFDASSNSGNYTSSANVQGYWRFAENSGTTTYDLSGDGNHGTISDATYSSPGADAFAPTMTITAAEGADGFTSNDPTLALTFTSSEAT